jgi:16S rRNA (guanine966-N2)-methyltransferase
MTRIIGGTAGGRRIRTPAGDRTRPTSDRVREALFSSLEAALGSGGRFAGLSVLDLYAGSGAIGLEAASRGATRVTCVEHDRRTASLIRDNARTAGLDVEVRAGTVATVLATPAAAAYDLVFTDPPYDLPAEAVERDLLALVRHGWLAADALVVVERSSRTPAVRWPAGLEPFGRRGERRYGETTLWYGRATGSD